MSESEMECPECGAAILVLSPGKDHGNDAIAAAIDGIRKSIVIERTGGAVQIQCPARFIMHAPAQALETVLREWLTTVFDAYRAN
jgi:hypothetical protein